MAKIMIEISDDDYESIKKGMRYRDTIADIMQQIENAEPVLSGSEKSNIRHCKNCKNFEYDSVAKVNGIPLIVAHEICKRWGDGCQSKEDGYCFLFEPKTQESEDSE